MLFAVLVFVTMGTQYASGQQPASQERVVEFKQALQKSQAQLRHYEWIETTTVSLKGEVKSQKQNRVYYGADGKLQKVAVGEAAAPQQQAQGRRGGRLKAKIVAKKKEEMSEYMHQAVDLIHKYVPPESGMIQFAKDNGKASYEVFDANKIVQLNLNDIIKVGDLMSAKLDINANSILEVEVSTYLDDAKDAVTLEVQFQNLPDGTNYSSQTTLNARAKEIKVVVENTGHRKVN